MSHLRASMTGNSFQGRGQMHPQSDAERCRHEIVRCREAFLPGLNEVWSDTRACTSFLTDAIAMVAHGFGAVVQREFALGIYRESTRRGRPCRKRGYLDLAAEFADGSTLAVEIDTGYKAWSARKLRFAKDHLMTELWVRWDGAYTWQSGIFVLNLEHPLRNWLSTNGRSSPAAGPKANASVVDCTSRSLTQPDEG